MKRILNDYVSVAEHEVELLRRSDDHPNVVRYFAMERDHQFTYIGLEIGVATLKEIVEGQNYIFLSFILLLSPPLAFTIEPPQGLPLAFTNVPP